MNDDTLENIVTTINYNGSRDDKLLVREEEKEEDQSESLNQVN